MSDATPKPLSLDDAMRSAMKVADTVRVPPVLAGSRFEIREELGRGGTSVVYAAFDKKLQREVAVKVLRDESRGDPEMAVRFRREAEMSAKLAHPNIVTIYDVGWEEGRMILVMELVRGRTLADALNDNDMLIRRGVEILELVSRAVHYAHGTGIIHRDLKPGNLLLSPSGLVKVADFGLARKLDSETALTQTGTTLGTPWYMAPEQAMGLSTQLSVRTDVYALGAILYHVLTGRAPHQGDNAADVIRRVAYEDPLPPSALNPGVPRDLELVALRALEKSPARRYTDAAAFADELRRHLDGARVLARPPSPARKAEKWVRRHVAISAAAAVLALGLAGLLAVWGVRRMQERWAVEALVAEVKAERDPDQAAYLCAVVQARAPHYPGINDLLTVKRSEARRFNARRLTKLGEAASARSKALETQVKALRADRDALFESIDTTTPSEKHAELWKLDENIAALERDLSQQRTQALHFHAAAVQADADYAEPRKYLSDYYWRAFKRAEWAGDEFHMAEAKGLLKLYDAPRSAECDRAWGSARLASDPPGAAIEVLRYEKGEDPRLVTRPVTDPLEHLPAGSYLAIFRLDGRRETRFPFAITRRYPKVEATVRLLTEAEIGGEYVHVPAGRAIVGPDTARKVREIGDLVVGRYEVTRGEYAAWLAELAAAGNEVELRKRTPSKGWEVRDGRPVPADPEWPDGWLKLPVIHVSWYDATAYCAWRAAKDGLPWRLPTTREREAIARGADGRPFPWGGTFDWTWTNGGRSRPVKAVVPVGSTPQDESPHGLRDLAGNVKEWCSSWQDKKARYRGIRGGGWGDLDWTEYRAHFPDGDPPNETDEETGFRMVRSVPAPK